MSEPSDGPRSRTIGDIDLTRAVAGEDPPATPVLVAEAADEPGEREPLQERLARVERLLEADLAALGPSVVTASIGELMARLDELAARIGEVDGRISTPSVLAPSGLEDRLDRLDRRVDRLTLLVEAATAPLDESTPADPALVRIEDAIAGLTTVVQQLVAIAERVDGDRDF